MGSRCRSMSATLARAMRGHDSTHDSPARSSYPWPCAPFPRVIRVMFSALHREERAGSRVQVHTCGAWGMARMARTTRNAVQRPPVEDESWVQHDSNDSGAERYSLLSRHPRDRRGDQAPRGPLEAPLRAVPHSGLSGRHNSIQGERSLLEPSSRPVPPWPSPLSCCRDLIGERQRHIGTVPQAPRSRAELQRQRLTSPSG
jgi:hypothetical protein